MAYHLAFHLEINEGFTVIPLTSAEDIFRFRDKTAKQIFLFDDAFGHYSVEQRKLSSWYNLPEYFLSFGNTDNLKIILTCRSQIYRTEDVQNLGMIQNDIHVHDAHNELSLDERKGICKMYLSENVFNLLDHRIISMYPYLPWICSAYENTCSDVVKFFEQPKTILKEEIGKLKFQSSYFSLALLILTNNKVETHFFENSKEFKPILKDLFKSSLIEYKSEPTVKSVKSGFRNIQTMIIDTEPYIYCVHDQVFDIIVHSVGPNFIKSILKFAHPEIIRSRIQFARLGQRYNEHTLLIDENLENIYFERILNFLKQGLNWTVFGNVQCQNEEYRKDFLCFLGKQPKPYFDFRSDSSSAFYVASYLGYYDFCKFIADNDISQVFKCIEGNWNSLYHICDKGHYKIAALVVKKMQEIDKTFFFLCQTLLFNLLFNRSIDTNMSIYRALYKTYSLFVKKLMMNHVTKPLMISIKRNNKNILSLFFPNDLELYRDVEKFGTPLHYACTLGRATITNMLIKNNACVNRKRKIDGFTPLHCSCRGGNDSIVKVLLEHGANINVISNRSTPLIEACLQSQTRIVKILLQNGASANKTNQCNSSPLHAAALIGNVEIIKVLLKSNPDVNFDMYGYNPLHIACSKGHLAVVLQLLNHYSPDTILKSTKFGISPLMIASFAGHIDIVRVLLTEGADVNFIDEIGTTPIKLAVQNDFPDVVEYLLENGAKINQTLHAACKQGNVNLVEFLLSKCANVYELDKNGGTPLHEACGCPDPVYNGAAIHLENETDIHKISPYIICVENFLQNLKNDIEEIYSRNERVKEQRSISCLHVACYHGDKSVINLQLQNGSDVNETCALGLTPLFVACLRGKDNIAKLLLEKGANVNQPCINGLTPLSESCLTGTSENVELLMESSANVNCKNSDGLVPLHIATMTGNTENIENLLKYGAHINKQNNAGQTSLFIACSENRINVVKLLIKNNAKVNLPSINNITPLDLVSSKGNFEIAELLLQHNASVNYGNNYSVTPLVWAYRYGHINIVDLLLKWKASVNQKLRSECTLLQLLCKNDSNLHDMSLSLILFWTFAFQFVHTKEYMILENWLPSAVVVYTMHQLFLRRIHGISFLLHQACSEGNERMVEVFLKHKANVNNSFPDGKSPLHKACLKRHMQVANILFKHGADINKQDGNGQSPLHIICEFGDRENARFLVTHGASINLMDNDGQTPLYIAAQNSNSELMEYLLENNGCVFSRCCNGRSPLHAACATNKTDPVDLLLRYGSEANDIDFVGNSPLHISCQYGHFNVAELLIEADAFPDLQNSHGQTPLHIACSHGYKDIVLLLLEYDASINIRDTTGKTVLHYACTNGFKDIVHVLLNYATIIYYKDRKTCLEICLEKSYVDVAKVILARLNIKREYINSLFIGACKSGSFINAKLLIKFNASLNAMGNDDKTPLFEASENGHLEIVKLLLRHKADIDHRCLGGKTPLFVACMNGHKNVAEYLIKQQADKCIRDADNILPYDVALLLGYTDICDILKTQMVELQKPVDPQIQEKYLKLRKNPEVARVRQEDKSVIKTIFPVNRTRIVAIFLVYEGLINMKDNNGCTPLHRACSSGLSEIVELLLKNGATFSEDKHGLTGLHFACLNGNENVALILIRYGAKVNQIDKYGNTPLHLACSFGYEKVAEILIKANANMNSINEYGMTPLIHAIRGNHEKVFKVLLEHGVSVNKPITLTSFLSNNVRSLGLSLGTWDYALLNWRGYMFNTLLGDRSLNFSNIPTLKSHRLLNALMCMALSYSRLFYI